MGVTTRCFLLRNWLSIHVCSISALHNVTTPIGLLQQSPPPPPKYYAHFLGGLPWNEVSLQLPHLPGEKHMDLPPFTDISILLHSATWTCSMLAGLAEGGLLSRVFFSRYVIDMAKSSRHVEFSTPMTRSLLQRPASRRCSSATWRHVLTSLGIVCETGVRHQEYRRD